MRFLIYIFILLQLQTYAQLKSNIENKISQLPRSTKTAIKIVDPESSEIIFTQNEKKSMIPASNTKLFTTACALSMLGENFLLSTKVLSDDFLIEDGIIDGNLYIKGFGNATFTESDLDSLVALIKESGIKEIKGTIVGDGSYFDNIYYRDDWILREYSTVNVPPVSSIVINRNKLIASIDSRRNLKISLEPGCNFYNINSSLKISSYRTRPRFTINTTEADIYLRIKGTVRKRRWPYKYAIYLDNPARYAAFLLHDKLKKSGITIHELPKEDSANNSRFEIASIDVPLYKYISFVNKNSDNYLAECLFKILGAEFSEEQGNSFYASQAVNSFIQENSINTEGTVIVDGSGISRHNTVTVASITDLLTKVFHKNDIFNAYYNSLAVSGVDGTLEDRLFTDGILRNFHGKTGTLRGVSAISGYLTTVNNKSLIVSIIMEFSEASANRHREIQDEIIEYLYFNY